MPDFISPLCLSNAQILRDETLQFGNISIAEGRLIDADLPRVDLSGYLVLPGIIDLHGDGFERHMTPRPSAPFPLLAGLTSYDREVAAHGVTTAYLAQGWSWEGGTRGPDQAEALMRALEAYQPQAQTDLRIQIRAETHLVGEAQRLLAAVQRHKVGYVVFNNHLAEAQKMARAAPSDFAHWARKTGTSAEGLMQAVELAGENQALVPRSLCTLAEAFDALGVIYGSHDDADGAVRDYYFSIGAELSEFPLSRQAAMAAHAMMSPVIMGAPNVVRGGSQAGNVAAQTLIADGLCDALVSDYHIPALPLAVWALVDRGVMGLAQAWEMVSSRPAKILGLRDRGRVQPGLRADLVVIHAQTRAIEATISNGRLSYLAGEAARRFMAQPQALRLAAE